MVTTLLEDTRAANRDHTLTTNKWVHEDSLSQTVATGILGEDLWVTLHGSPGKSYLYVLENNVSDAHLVHLFWRREHHCKQGILGHSS
ncbi:hypothetical protein Clacol_008544 [Clathrus columnatus]|uniref:Uncharacterized protein n=1 Tax=Clathrus columnatus TaxID=1419009 RepID=A0AAV5AIU6_9AGAM|nr:hypothetical protein Clacol_008544 [Clathrus columnatus]